MYISFNWTAPAVRAKAKTTTLRQWATSHAQHFHEGDIVDAWDRSPRQHGQRFGRVLLTARPQLGIIRTHVLASSAGPEHDDETLTEALWRSEGFAYFHEHPEHRPSKLFGKSTAGIDFGIKWFEEWCLEHYADPFYLVRFTVLEPMAVTS